MANPDGPRLSDLSLASFRQLILEESGILFDEAQRPRLELALSQRMKATGLRSYEEYYTGLTGSADARPEMQELLNAITVQETQFFRNQPQFDALAERVLPHLIRERKERQSLGIWSAGCATGEEPYSLAMTLLTQLPPGWGGCVVGTDISTKALSVAQRGLYSPKAVKHLPEDVVRRFFCAEDERFSVSDEVRALAAFQRHNLLEETLPLQLACGVDIIFCRNVLIYFSADKRSHIVDWFYRILSSGGYLFLGHSETLWKINSEFRLERYGEAFIYRKEARLTPKLAPKGHTARRREHGPAGERGDSGKNRLRLVEVDTGKTKKERREAPAAKGGSVESLPAQIPGNCAGDTSADVIKAAKQAMDKGEYGRALELLGKAVREDCLAAVAHFLAGCVYQRQGDIDRARKTFRKVLFLDPTCALAHLHLATIAETRGERAVAEREYRNAIKAAGQGLSPHYEDFLEGLTVESFVQICAIKAEALSAPEVKTGKRR